MKENRPVLFLSVTVFGLMTLLALVYYQERIINLDMAFQAFLILKSGSLEIQSGRFGAAVTQIWPWTAQALGLPLKGVLLAYSLGHVLWPPILAFFCWRIGQWRWSLAIGLVATLMTTHTFYWLSEMPAGLVFLCAVFAWMHSKGSLSAFRWWQAVLWLGALVTAFYFHPLVLYAQAFLCLYFMLDREKSRSWVWLHLFALAVFGALVVLKYKILKLDWYDAAALKRQEAFSKLWPNWIDLESNRMFLKWSITDYWLLWLVLVANLIYFIWRKNWAKAALATFWPLGFVLLVNVPFYEAVGQQFYMENLYLPLAVFGAVPFVFDVLQGQKTESGLRRTSILVLAGIFGLSLFRIQDAHQGWTNKIAWEKEFLGKTAVMPQKMLVLTEQQAPMDTLKMSWGSAFEFLMLSAMESPDSSRCLIVHEAPQRFDTLLNKPGVFFGAFKNYRFEELPEQYFVFRDSSGYKRWMETGN